MGGGRKGQQALHPCMCCAGCGQSWLYRSARGEAGRARVAKAPGTIWPHLAEELRWAGLPLRGSQTLGTGAWDLENIHFKNMHQESGSEVEGQHKGSNS